MECRDTLNCIVNPRRAGIPAKNIGKTGTTINRQGREKWQICMGVRTGIPWAGAAWAGTASGVQIGPVHICSSGDFYEWKFIASF